MKEFFPNYYHKFKCIAGECRHSCCIGWEIDIDPDTYALYESLDSPLGQKIRAHIAGDPPHFVLGEGERCPFLDQDGLCEIIREHGDGALCDICYLHPRFSHFHRSFTETGLGLCCEEAARIILSEEEPFQIARPFWLTIKERRFFRERQAMIEALQNRKKSMGQRLSDLAAAYGLFEEAPTQLVEKYLALERLDETWTTLLQEASFHEGVLDEKALQIPLEQFAVYLVFRHFGEGAAKEILAFVWDACRLLGALVSANRQLPFWELVRRYSAEVEYSTENLALLLKS